MLGSNNFLGFELIRIDLIDFPLYHNCSESIPNYVWDHFAETLPMSTYLLAYAITDFSHISLGNFSVWARADAIQSAKYALSVGPKILDFLENFFGIAFPLPKMDMIALPEFQAGAMENWGLITFRETAMLYEKGISTASNKQRVASVVGHELAHQWFGNLVTPSWWSDIWLNEGFASYMEYLTANAVAPEWKLLDEFVVNELQTVFQLDALTTSHKISQEVGNPQEIFELFDRISYAKGSTVIRMMSHFLTDTVFRRGLSNYLREMYVDLFTEKSSLSIYSINFILGLINQPHRMISGVSSPMRRRLRVYSIAAPVSKPSWIPGHCRLASRWLRSHVIPIRMLCVWSRCVSSMATAARRMTDCSGGYPSHTPQPRS